MGKILRTQHGELCLIPSTQEKVVGGSVIKLWGGVWQRKAGAGASLASQTSQNVQ